ncbi:MAG: acylphosphatase [Nanoarchaeota archaeon]
MKKSVRLHITGNMQAMFYERYIKENAQLNNLKGYFRKLEDGRYEIFLEGNFDNVNSMIELCKKGFQQSTVRNLDLKEEKFQDFKDFKVLKI